MYINLKNQMLGELIINNNNNNNNKGKWFNYFATNKNAIKIYTVSIL